MGSILQYLFSKKIALYIIGILIFLIFSFWLLPLSLPIVFAFFSVLILEPFVIKVQKILKKKRSIAVLIVFLLFLLFLGISTFLLSTKFIVEGIQFVEKIPMYINKVNQVWADIESNLYKISKNLPPTVVTEISSQVEEFLNQAKNNITTSLNIENIKVFFTNVPNFLLNFLLNFLIYLVALFLILIDLPRIKKRIYTHLTDKTAVKVNFMTSRLSFVIFGFLKAQFLVSIIIFIVSLIGLLFILPKVALLMAFIIWIIDFIPIIGSIIIIGPWSLFYFLTGNLLLGTKLVILAVVLIIIRRTVEPKVMGRQIGLSPISTLIAMYLGLQILGIVGFIIGPLLLITFNSAREAGIIKINFKL